MQQFGASASTRLCADINWGRWKINYTLNFIVLVICAWNY